MRRRRKFLPSDVRRGAAKIALSLLDDGAHAFQRLRKGSDPDALHDLRVATRRLRVHLRAYRTWLAPAVTHAMSRRLKRIAKATSPARDTQVQLIWLRQQQPDPDRHVRAAIETLIRLYARRERAQQRKILNDVRSTFPRLESGLRVRLLNVQEIVDERAPQLGVVAADAIRRRARSLRKKLRMIRALESNVAIHAARIAGKKLRYLIEPFAADIPGGRPCLARLKALQDCLGEIHDRRVFAVQLRVEARLIGKNPAVSVLLNRVHVEAEALYCRMRTRYLGKRIGVGFVAHRQFAQRLELGR